MNIKEVASKFKMVEFLSGSLNLYFFNNLQKRTINTDPALGFTSPVTFFIAYQTSRRWLPEISPSGVQEEIVFPNITGKDNIWEQVSELPGVSGKFISNAGGQNQSKSLDGSSLRSHGRH